ncbi:hypothetical protein [Nonomuraea sp. NPDC050691]|uniref:hypothetical protein n=1 Tax=Nonomuraea sp. NPDC050691 TaxID=3155661 RepID=UPI0033EBD9F4
MKDVVKKAVATAGAAALAGIAVLVPASPAAALGKYLETQRVACPDWGVNIYYDNYDNNPGLTNAIGYRVTANECHTKAFVMSARVRLVVSCSWGFTYAGQPQTLVEGRKAFFETTSQSETGCLFGVSDYWLEEV